MRNYKGLKIWRKGFEISRNAYAFVKNFPKEEKYGLASQITRAAVSIPVNIAEGTSRKSNRDFCRYLEISLGSSFELETEIMLAMDLSYGSQEIGNKLLIEILEEQKMLSSYALRLKEDINP